MIELKKTNDISQLENQLMLLGFNGMAYSDEWKRIARKLDELKRKGDE